MSLNSALNCTYPTTFRFTINLNYNIPPPTNRFYLEAWSCHLTVKCIEERDFPNSCGRQSNVLLPKARIQTLYGKQ